MCIMLAYESMKLGHDDRAFDQHAASGGSIGIKMEAD
jgi:hypothetical protein